MVDLSQFAGLIHKLRTTIIHKSGRGRNLGQFGYFERRFGGEVERITIKSANLIATSASKSANLALHEHCNRSDGMTILVRGATTWQRPMVVIIQATSRCGLRWMRTTEGTVGIPEGQAEPHPLNKSQ